MNQIDKLFQPAHDHATKNAIAAQQIMQSLRDLPPYHPGLEEFEFEAGILNLQCFYEVEPAQEETRIDPPIDRQVILCYVYVGNIDVLKALTDAEKATIVEAIKGAI